MNPSGKLVITLSLKAKVSDLYAKDFKYFAQALETLKALNARYKETKEKFTFKYKLERYASHQSFPYLTETSDE